MYRTILVPVDGSPFGEHALALAIHLAVRAKAELHVVHVHTPLKMSYAEIRLYDETLEGELKEQQRAYLEGLRQKLTAMPGLAVRTMLREGDVVGEVHDHLRECGAGLIVMTTHARGPLGRFWLGSVADRLVREAPMPVVLVHPRPGPADFREVVPLKHIMVSLDGSPFAEKILDSAVNLGRLMDADYTLLRIIKAVFPFPYNVEGTTLGQMAQNLVERIDKVQEELKGDAHNYLEGVAQRLRGQGLRVKTLVAVDDQPAAGLVHQAVAPVADVLAIASHGRHGLGRLFHTSVADQVVRHGNVPVLVFTPKE
jgi:nucleotide-binding universal stress UspA family protein